CSSCHIFGDNDDLAWDLGNPDGDYTISPIEVRLGTAAGSRFPNLNGEGSKDPAKLHPMKGPVTTQTLRGMVNSGPMHWRGDRVSGAFGPDTRTAPPFDSNLAFMNFVVAFEGLLGRSGPIADQDMQAFTDFALKIVLPPNPVRALDNTLNAQQALGKRFFM